MNDSLSRTRSDRAKRALDILLSSILIIVTAPIQLVVAALIRKKMGAPVLFRQGRPGLHGEVFQLVKFRSMLGKDIDQGLVTDQDRLTSFGRFLRSTSLDELPTLWNVLKGDMSLVGPRPLLVSYLGRYSQQQKRRHEVRPGVTGLAQVRGRNSLTWDEKFALDVEYVDQRSFRMDCRILAETIGFVLARRGIAAPGNATMPEFGGLEDSTRMQKDV